MTAIEILLLLSGGVIFVVSFLIPGKANPENKEASVSKEQIKELFEEEIKEARANIRDMADETVSYSVEKAERALERITNEKMSAVSEFSDTVLTDINKNRDEIMFLYDMLNDKQENLKKDISEANSTAKEARKAKEELQGVLWNREEEVPAPAIPDDRSFVPFGAMHIERIHLEDEVENETAPQRMRETSWNRMDHEDSEPVKAQKDEYTEEITQGRMNSNKKILRLYRMNRSAVDIAKELGLGVGEVKLVIDLYNDMNNLEDELKR